MLLKSCIDCLLIGQYKMKWRTHHSTVHVVNSDRLYYEVLMISSPCSNPLVHYNDEKRKFTSSVDIFHLPTLKWERKSTTTTPPAEVMDYACTNIRDNILLMSVASTFQPSNLLQCNIYNIYIIIQTYIHLYIHRHMYMYVCIITQCIYCAYSYYRGLLVLFTLVLDS